MIHTCRRSIMRRILTHQPSLHDKAQIRVQVGPYISNSDPIQRSGNIISSGVLSAMAWVGIAIAAVFLVLVVGLFASNRMKNVYKPSTMASKCLFGVTRSYLPNIRYFVTSFFSFLEKPFWNTAKSAMKLTKFKKFSSETDLTGWVKRIHRESPMRDVYVSPHPNLPPPPCLLQHHHRQLFRKLPNGLSRRPSNVQRSYKMPEI